MKPRFDDVWKAFPDHIAYPTLKDLYEMLGGAAEKNIYSPGFGPNGNACASRMSVALNRGGAPISEPLARSVKARTVGTQDGNRIIYGVADLRRYLEAAFGAPTPDEASPFDDGFGGKKGIVAFAVTGWSGATGHIALHNGRTYREPSYDNYATYSTATARTTRGEFWELR